MTPYAADSSLKGKLRRKYALLTHRRPAALNLDGPVVSFTFDDAPASSMVAADLLEQRGVHGTWYLCAGLFGQDGHMGRFADADEAADLAKRGHEIGCHTLDHVDCHRTDDAGLISQSQANIAALQALGGGAHHFAFPYGEISPRAKRTLGPRYGSLRTVAAGLVHEGSDLNQLPSVGIEGPDGEAFARHWIDKAVAQRAWVILFTHDVRDDHSPWGCAPGAIARLADHALASGAAIRTVGQVLDR